MDQPLTLGQPSPASPLARTVNPVKVTIGGEVAEVLSSGLTPGFAGLYRVNAKAPAKAQASVEAGSKRPPERSLRREQGGEARPASVPVAGLGGG
ncbi:MAG: hypothetical protein AAB654_25185 [Acidobacteriota bacterium]